MIDRVRDQVRHLTPLHQAERWACEVATMLAPGVESLEAAGSLRRRHRDVKDIEFIIRPLFKAKPKQLGLFQPPGACEYVSNFDGYIDDILRAPNSLLTWAPDEQTSNGPRKCPRGPKRKRLQWRGQICIDLFIVHERSTYGLQLAIRTGDRHFSQALVTRRNNGGLLPDGYGQRDWQLYDDAGRRIETPTEESYFQAIGLPWIDPRLRCQAKVDELRKTPPRWTAD